MSDQNASAPADPPPAPRGAPGEVGLAVLFLSFARISMLSVGGGLTAWIRRLVVEQKGWMDESHFLSGYALAQVAPGPNAVNLSVFVGQTLAGARGAAASLLGLTAPPLVVVLALGWLYGSRPVPHLVGNALSGMGAAAIGLVVATGLRMARHGIRAARPALVATASGVAIAAGLKLIPVVAVALPVALLVL